MPSFNLIDEPFIPCLKLSGNSGKYGLKQILLDAHEIAEIRDGSPLVTIALHRLLLAILHRCYMGPKKSSDRVAIRQLGAFDAKRIEEYFKKYNDRFDLFHETYPFFQLDNYRQNEPSPPNRLVKELSRGNNAVLFDHTTDEPALVMTPEQAARAVITEQLFAYSAGRGRAGEPHTLDAPIGRAAEVFALGDNLFQTLWLNLTIYDCDEQPIASDEDDCPIWERPPHPPHADSQTPRGYLDYMTWQSRTLRLHPEADGDQTVIRRVSYSQGRVWKQMVGCYDPYVAYKRDPSDGDRPILFKDNHDLWRDSAALFQFGETDQFKGPTNLQTLGWLVADGHLASSDRYRLLVAGARVESGQPNLIFWRHESLPLPLAYLEQRVLVEVLKHALKLTEDVANQLEYATKKGVECRLTGQAGMRPDMKRVGQILNALAPSRFYWSRLERPFRELLVALAAEGADLSACVQGWYWDTLHPTAEKAFDESIGRIDGGRDLKAVNAGRGILFSRLKKLRNDNHIPNQVKEGAA